MLSGNSSIISFDFFIDSSCAHFSFSYCYSVSKLAVLSSSIVVAVFTVLVTAADGYFRVSLSLLAKKVLTI